MIDCTLANASMRNRAIGSTARHARALYLTTNDLISVVQSRRDGGEKDGAAGIAEVATSLPDAAGDESVQCRGWRIGPLCNERTFTIGHGHASCIGTHCRTDSEVSP
jgi:hypothetical protein